MTMIIIISFQGSHHDHINNAHLKRQIGAGLGKIEGFHWVPGGRSHHDDEDNLGDEDNDDRWFRRGQDLHWLSCENEGDEDSDKDWILYKTCESHNLMWMLSEI